MRSVLLAPRAEFLEHQALFHGLLVALREIVDMAALGALKLDEGVL